MAHYIGSEKVLRSYVNGVIDYPLSGVKKPKFWVDCRTTSSIVLNSVTNEVMSVTDIVEKTSLARAGSGAAMVLDDGGIKFSAGRYLKHTYSTPKTISSINIFVAMKMNADSRSQMVRMGNAKAIRVHLPYNSIIYWDVVPATSTALDRIQTSYKTIGKREIFNLSYQSLEQSIRMNNVEIIKAVRPNNTFTWDISELGLSANNTLYEFLMFDEVLSETEKTAIHEYLADKWAVTG